MQNDKLSCFLLSHVPRPRAGIALPEVGGIRSFRAKGLGGKHAHPSMAILPRASRLMSTLLRRILSSSHTVAFPAKGAAERISAASAMSMRCSVEALFNMPSISFPPSPPLA